MNNDIGDKQAQALDAGTLGRLMRLLLGQRGRLQRMLDWLYGYDYFICYRWSDGRTYAIALAEQLETNGFKCFLDSEDYVKGDNWKKIGERSLKKTSRLVFVGSMEAVCPTKARRPTTTPSYEN